MKNDLGLGRAAGGYARARSLTPERRREISANATEAKRARSNLPQVTHAGVLNLSGVEIQCYVTENGERLLSNRGMQLALGLEESSKSGTRLDRVLESKWFNNIVPENMPMALGNPTLCAYKGTLINGFRAEALADFCEIMLIAKDDPNITLTSKQQDIAQRCEKLVRGFFRVGIVALVDEVTGYEKERKRGELAKILESFVAPELQPWVKTFPVVFYEQMFRLRNLAFDPLNIKRPQYFGHLTNTVIYERMPPGVLEELKKKIKELKKQGTYHQFLTPHIGHPSLTHLLASVITIMKLSDNWDSFLITLDKIHPSYKNEKNYFLHDGIIEEFKEGI